MKKIHLKNISKKFGSVSEQKVLDNLDLEIEKGDLLAITGVSGSGKSTLLYILGLLDSDYDGEYYIDDKSMQSLSDKELSEYRSKTVGFIYQDFNLIKELSALDNVAMSLKINNLVLDRRSRLSRKEIYERSKDTLEKLGLKEHMKKRPGQLSGGQQQRVAIARSIVKKPDMILADEPTGALDRKTSEEIMHCIQELNDEGMTIIIVTHDGEIAKKCRRKVMLVDGVLCNDV